MTPRDTSLDQLLAKVATEVSDEDVTKAQKSVEAMTSEPQRMIYRMFAATPKN